MTTFQPGSGSDFSRSVSGHVGSLKPIPEWGNRSKESKNNSGVLQSYVTYGTLPDK
jgi:hypothetical protein